MRFFSDILRMIAAFTAVYTFYIGHTGDALIVFAITLGTCGFKLRRAILIEPSRAADAWEFALTLLFTVNIFFVALGIYYVSALNFFDVAMHFGGGVIGGWWAYLALTRSRTLILERARALVFIVGAAALLGVGWELFEWGLDNTIGAWYVAQKAQPGLDDSMGDLALDVLGGIVAGLTLLRSRNQNS